MLTITISGERGEGKTFLAWVIMFSLRLLAPKYSIEYKEDPNEQTKRQMQGYYERTSMPNAIERMEPRKVQLIIHN